MTLLKQPKSAGSYRSRHFSISAFEERCREGEKEFERMSRLTRSAADFYNFRYTVGRNE